MSNSVRPHWWQPTRLPHPWDSPDKKTGVGCHFLLQCMKVKSESEVDQSCPTRSDPMDYSLPGSSVHGIFQARLLEWGATAFSAFKPGANHKTHSGWEITSTWGEQIFMIAVFICREDMFFSRQWQPTPVLLPGKSHGRRSLVGYSPWGLKESDTTEQLHFNKVKLLN